MKSKVTALLGIAVLLVALAAAPGVAKPKVKKVQSKISLNFAQGTTPYSPYTQDTFFGHVKAKKGCKKKRKVVINNTSLSTKTNNSGDYSVAAGNASPGTYTATVKKKKIKKNGVKIICKKATSNPVTVTG